MIRRLNNKQVKILKGLARYKFLTYSQIRRLGIEKHKSNLSNIVSSMRDSKRPLVKKIPHHPGTEAKHYLTAKGKDVILDLYGSEYDETSIQYLKKTLYTDTQDQKHRTSIIDIQIELDFACYENALQLLLCERYFDMTGNQRVLNNLKSKTAITYNKGQSINADLSFIFQTATQKELYLLELENGGDSGKAVEKCIRHGQAILKGSANKKYDHQQGYRTLWVFERPGIMKATIRKVAENPFFKNMEEYFLFKPMGDIGEDFFGGWLNLSGDERKLYYI